MDMTDDTTTARRDLLGLLLSRAERGNLTDAERPLLRPLVEAEMRHGQAVIDQYAADAPWLKAYAEDHQALVQRHDDLIAETQRQGEVHERTAQRLKRAEARLDRVNAQAVDWSRLAAPGDVGMTPGDTAFAEAGRIILDLADEPARRVLAALDGPTPDDEPATPVTDWATSVDKQCPAHYKGEPPQLTQPAWDSVDYRCERRGHGLDSDHAARLAQGSGTVAFHWTDAIAVYPTNDAPSETETPSAARCSPLVNADCPGHTGPDRCERAASSPAPQPTTLMPVCNAQGPWGDDHRCIRPVEHADAHESRDGCGWEDGTPKATACTAQYTGEPGETWHCTLNTGHPGDHVTAADGNNYWNDHVGTYPAAAPLEEPTP